MADCGEVKGIEVRSLLKFQKGSIEFFYFLCEKVSLHCTYNKNSELEKLIATY